jgi:hypothetical protein
MSRGKNLVPSGAKKMNLRVDFRSLSPSLA